MSSSEQSAIFMVGCVRSGTTMLRNLLRSHPHLLCPEETQYYRWGDPFGTKPFLNQVGVSPLLKKHRGIDGVDEEEFQEVLTQSRSRKDLLERFMKLFLRSRGREDARWFDKSPQNVYGIPLLLHDFPDARFVHIVRNPLNVVASLLEGKVIGAPNAIAAANYWNEAVAIINTLKPLLGSQLYEVRYEDLTCDPVHQTRKIVEFLGEDPQLLQLREKQIHEERNKYVQVLTAADYEDINAVCHRWARYYAYQLEPTSVA